MTGLEAVELMGQLKEEKEKLERGIVEFEEEAIFYKENGQEDIHEAFLGYANDKKLLLTETKHAMFKLDQALKKVDKVMGDIKTHNGLIGKLKVSLSNPEIIEDKSVEPNYGYKKKAF